MKKKVDHSAEASSEPASDYVVGQVSGSLFKKSSAASGSLAALFSTTTPAASLLFQPAPEPVQRGSEQQQQKKETPEVKGQKKKLPEKSAAEQKLENRESSLQEADEDERGKGMSVKKRKASGSGRENDTELWVMKRQRTKACREEESVKRKRTVFVGNLPISCTKKTLRSLFRNKGSIESIRFRSVVREDPSISRKVAAIKRKIHPKKQSVNAYVVFTDDDGVAKALESNGTEIEKDFHIRVDRVTDSSSHDHKRSVFVGNLSFEINESAFRQHFEECGSVEAVRLVRDQNSGLGKGFGYILFESPDSVQLALKLDGSKLEGRAVRVKRSVKKEKQKKKTNDRGTTGRPGRGPAKGAAKGPAKSAAKGPAKGPGRERGGFKSQKKFTGNQQRPTKSSGSFKGQMVDPIKKKKLKKKVKPNKTVHI
ncbi:RNA-binding protein 34 isoform X1 [Hippoglossus hippoglossus]|uniref:RNA-binding protein 34 isoform X1 n=1 Tax=Hippoglossus hippoglossus TaxID=8267 RepID=UPI00148C1B95|nr:RNA-binding protein 34 isoform X1 [Hippoglossus hippoglossus]